MSTDARARRPDGPLARIAAVFLAAVIVFLKVDGLRLLIHNPRTLAGAAFCLGALGMLDRARPIGFCTSAGIAAGILVAVQPWWVEIPIGLATIILLLAGSYALGVWLNRREQLS
ncbi:MAG: hypothetical protein J2O48_11850 [Solirubrobacterales bacterium]|nr:hypothetical protein [Solirubrobacterales bacterium]